MDRVTMTSEWSSFMRRSGSIMRGVLKQSIHSFALSPSSRLFEVVKSLTVQSVEAAEDARRGDVEASQVAEAAARVGEAREVALDGGVGEVQAAQTRAGGCEDV